MTVVVQTLLTEDDLRSAMALSRTAMVGLPPLAPSVELSEPAPALGAYVDGELIGTAELYTGWLVVRCKWCRLGTRPGCAWSVSHKHWRSGLIGRRSWWRWSIRSWPRTPAGTASRPMVCDECGRPRRSQWG